MPGFPGFLANLRDQTFNQRQYSLHHAGDAPGIGMNAIGLIECRLQRDTIEDEGIEERPMLTREGRKHGLEFADIFRAEILNAYLGVKDFDFKSFEAGFARACIEFYEKI